MARSGCRLGRSGRRAMKRKAAAETPTPAEIAAVRTRVGLTQAECARLAGMKTQPRWAEYEAGKHRMDGWRWRYFLHVAGIRRLPFTERRGGD